MWSEYIAAAHGVFCLSGIPRRSSWPLERAQRRHRHTRLRSRRGSYADAQDDHSASHRLQLDHRSVTYVS